MATEADLTSIDPIAMLRPRRRIKGMSAVLLPFSATRSIDWDAFTAHVRRTADAGLTPAVNMDTGYVNLIDEATRQRVLEVTRSALDGRPFVAGAFVADTPGSKFNRDAYLKQIHSIDEFGATPVIFQSFGLKCQSDDAIIDSYLTIGLKTGPFIAFEMNSMFAPYGTIYSLDVYRGLLGIPQCIGAKHSSLQREPEWLRLRMRDQVRPDFHVFTGNDRAIDMVMYGSDYLLGISTFAPDLFARRDAMWYTGDPAFYQLNDAIQDLGRFAFRVPIPGYRHTAAMFLKLRGWLSCDATHPENLRRPDSDRAILSELATTLGVLDEGIR